MSTKSASIDSANHELASNDSTSYKLKVKQDLCARESNASETYQKRDQENLTLLRSYIHFVPFMAKLLSGQKPAHHIETEEILRHSKSLVNADLLCQEALESLKEMITEVIFDQLTMIGVEKKTLCQCTPSNCSNRSYVATSRLEQAKSSVYRSQH